MRAAPAGIAALALVLAACRSPGRPGSGDDPSWVIVVSADRTPPFQVSVPGGERVPVCGPLVAAADAVSEWRVGSCLPAPDGRRIAFSAAPHGVFVAETDDPRRGIRQVQGLRDALGWSPDGERLAGNVWSRSGNGPLDYGLGVADARTGEVRSYWGVLTDDPAQNQHIAFSPQGDRLAFTSLRNGVAVLDLSSGAVTEPGLPGATRDAELLAWLPDGRIAWFVRSGGSVLVARPDDVEATSIPLGKDEFPLSCRPDGRAVVCWAMYSRFPLLRAYLRAVIRDADGRSFELWDDGPSAEVAVWMRAPGLLVAPPGSQPEPGR